jgi:ribosomal protein L40E
LYAQIQPDGNLGNWLPTTSLPTTVAGYAAAIWNGRIYAIIGGWPGWKGEVYYAQINADGSLGNWNPTTSLPQPRRAPTVAIRNGIMYVIGGQKEGVYYNTVYYATIAPATGEVGAWSTTAPFPTNIQNAQEVLVDKDIYIIAGDDGSIAFDTAYRPNINAGGSIDSWTQMHNSLPEPRTIHASVVYDGRIYVLGGSTTGGGMKSTIYYSSKIVPSPPPDPPLWMQWLFWTTIALGAIVVVLAFTTVRYRRKPSVSKETSVMQSKTTQRANKVCPKCGANLPADSKFCGKCGTSLE